VIVREVPTPSTDPATMEPAGEDAESVGYQVGYGWRVGPAPGSPWYLGFRIEGAGCTESDVAGGYLAGGGNLGVQLLGVIAEVGMGFGAMGLGSFEGGEVTPVAMAALNFGFPLRDHLRLYFLRLSFAGRVLADRTDLGGGFFGGIGAEWTPEDD
jgi:hypothetical protein